MKPITLQFAFERSTKNTHRYAEIVKGGGDAVVGVLYIKKAAMKELPSPEITVTIVETQ